MKFVKRHLGKRIRELEKLKRRYHHPKLHKVKTLHHISGHTLYCVKEYGKKSHVSHVIIRESIKILILASIISSIGGVALQTIEQKITAILPLLILIPALNHTIGSFGTIVSSKFTELIYADKIRGSAWHSKELHNLFFTAISIAAAASIYIGVLSYFIAYMKGFAFSLAFLLKILEVSVLATLSIVTIIFFISVSFGSYICSKREDPNNFLIPISTSIADVGSMAIFSAMVVAFF
ncbi:MAG: magnesium transporter [Candidatus Aenigmarchaeota archaeon]|nr:magnesium transporter [Candidatus Aenigmarchaeota archaeon]